MEALAPPDADAGSLLLYAVTALTLVAVPAAVLLSRTKKKRRRATLERSWSFTSEGMRAGVFPESVRAPETVINVALYFHPGDCPSEAELADGVISPLLKYDRFSKVPDGGGLVLRESANPYDASDLVRTVSIDGNDDLLHSTICGILPDKLDRGRDDKPLWEMVRISNANGTGRSAVVMRVHHWVGDGVSLVTVCNEIIATKDGKSVESKVTKALMNRKGPTPSLWSVLSAAAHVLTLGDSKHDDPTVLFKARDSGLRCDGKSRVSLFPDVPLQYIKDLKGRAPGPVSVNDVLLCAVSQALHEYCLMEKDPVLQSKGNKLQCRALLPVSLPRGKDLASDTSTALKNLFVMMSSDLSVGHAKIIDRLMSINATTSFLKRSPRAFVMMWFQNKIAPYLPDGVRRQTAYKIFSRHNLVLTNVPGPDQSCWLAGRQVTGMQLFFPNVIPQVDLLTYAGMVHGNVVYQPSHWTHGNRIGPLYAKALVGLGQELGLAKIPAGLKEAAEKLGIADE